MSFVQQSSVTPPTDGSLLWDRVILTSQRLLLPKSFSLYLFATDEAHQGLILSLSIYPDTDKPDMTFAARTLFVHAQYFVYFHFRLNTLSQPLVQPFVIPFDK